MLACSESDGIASVPATIEGMGDVLAGLTGALVAQGLSLMEASALGVATHARAGDLAWERYGVGLTATDVANGLGVDL